MELKTMVKHKPEDDLVLSEDLIERLLKPVLPVKSNLTDAKISIKDPVEHMIQNVSALHADTTSGLWRRGETSHHLESFRGSGKGYQLSEHRHAVDADFASLSHAIMPALLDLIKLQRRQIESLKADK